uniref:Receptor ligand binding region domain-containing protein n=1 Tax=Glossina brevipalpis TaxID=37001 RepID=A0A1A9WQ74_9MUSC
MVFDEEELNKTVVKICNQIKIGVQAIFGPSNGLLSCHINSICDALDIPHMEIKADAEYNSREFSINLHPFQDIINDALLDIIHYLNWTKVAVLHENHYGAYSLIIPVCVFKTMQALI